MGKKLSLILPVYNGSSLLQQHIPGVIDYLDQLSFEYEIIVVDDGSKDGDETMAVSREFGCVFISNPKNMGKGAALRAGMLRATGDFRIFTDVDIPYEFEVIEKFLWYLDFKEFHVVVGDRTLQGSKYFTEVPWGRNVGSKIYSFIVGRFVVSGLFDTQCGIKGFRAEVAEDIFGVSRINRFAIDVEILYIALKRNYDIKRLPVSLRIWEPSQIHPIRDGSKMLVDLFSIWLNYRLGRYEGRKKIDVTIDTYYADRR